MNKSNLLSMHIAVLFLAILVPLHGKTVTEALISDLLAPDASFIVSLGPRPDTLTESEFLRLVRLLHPEMRIAQLQEYRAQAGLTASWGTLDPVFGIRASTKYVESDYKNNDLTASLELPLYWGPSIELGLRRSSEFFNQDYLTPNNGEGIALLRVPLWRNLLIDSRRTSILKAEQGVTSGSAANTLRRNALFLRALRDYWDWSGAYHKYVVARRLYEIGLERYEAIRQEISRGESAPIDSVEALQELMRRKGTLVRARLTLERSTMNAAYHIWDLTAAVRLFSTYAPEPFPEPLIPAHQTLEKEISQALQRRPELLQLQAEIQIHTLDAQFARELTKPNIDVELSAIPSISGLSTLRNQPRYKVGLSFGIPILTRRGRGLEQVGLATASELQSQFELAKRLVDIDVRMGFSSLTATAQQVLVARTERQLAELMARSEQILFQQGESDLFRLNFRERLLGEALDREIDALVSYAQSVVFYRWARADFY